MNNTSNNTAKFRIVSTELFTCAELDGKSIGVGIEEIHFSSKKENGKLVNKLELKIDLNSFEFMRDGEMDRRHNKYLEVTSKDNLIEN